MEFARLAHTFEELERTSSRLALIGLLTQLFRSIERPDDIEKVCYLVQGRVAPFFEALEMGMAEKTVARSIAIASHTTPEHVLTLYATPLMERLRILEEAVHPAEDTLMLTASHIVKDASTLTLLFDEARSLGLEGLVVKKLESRYEVGARNFNWVKLKRHSAWALNDTIDCVLLGYLFGRGKRAALGAGALLVGV